MGFYLGKNTFDTSCWMVRRSLGSMMHSFLWSWYVFSKSSLKPENRSLMSFPLSYEMALVSFFWYSSSPTDVRCVLRASQCPRYLAWVG